MPRILQATPSGYMVQLDDGSTHLMPEHVAVRAGMVQPTAGSTRVPIASGPETQATAGSPPIAAGPNRVPTDVGPISVHSVPATTDYIGLKLPHVDLGTNIVRPYGGPHDITKGPNVQAAYNAPMVRPLKVDQLGPAKVEMPADFQQSAAFTQGDDAVTKAHMHMLKLAAVRNLRDKLGLE